MTTMATEEQKKIFSNNLNKYILLMYVATQGAIHHKFNPCETIGSITCYEEKTIRT